MIRLETEVGGKKITLETGRLAKQADGSVLVTCNETVVLVAVVSAPEAKPGQSFFPLTVEYQEKYYAAGKIPGGFFKREARPTSEAILTMRLIDRPLRPLFPEGYLNETQVIATVLSLDKSIEPGILASIGASAALTISNIPFSGPTAAVQVARVNGELVANPTALQLETADLEMIVAGSEKAILMVEGGAHFISEDDLLKALEFGHKSIQGLIKIQKELREKVGVAKREFVPALGDADFKAKAEAFLAPKIRAALNIREKAARYDAYSAAKDEAKAQLVETITDKDQKDVAAKELGGIVEMVKYTEARRQILKDKVRIDGRNSVQIRPIACEVGVLPRVHGSALFTRGETQVLGTVTLGTSDDEQMIDGISGNYYRKFMLHYNFPNYSVGEVGRMGSTSRREIGHGALAERSLKESLPPAEKFPYTIRIVNEVFESNGSSSMGSVCSGSMAMMQAGVPITEPIAGIAMGLIKEGEDIAILSDILGDEDHLGDMDFKVAGSHRGVTGFQMDIKIEGVTFDIMKKALYQAKEGRLHILGEMAKAITIPVTEVSIYAPRIVTVQVKPEKVRELIGPGGKMIKSIIEATGVKIDISDDGKVNVASSDSEAIKKALAMINAVTAEAEVGKVYSGIVKRIVDFGAFVEIMPGTDGLLHISEIAHERIRQVTDVLKEGDTIDVKVMDVDRAGKIKLSRKAVLAQTMN